MAKVFDTSDAVVVETVVIRLIPSSHRAFRIEETISHSAKRFTILAFNIPVIELKVVRPQLLRTE